MSYAAEVAKKGGQSNLIIQIGSDYFGNANPDSGLSLDSTKKNCIRRIKIPSVRLDIREAHGSISEATIELTDNSGNITAYMGANETTIYNATITIWHGYLGVSMAFSDYKAISTLKVKKAQFNGLVWTLHCNTIMDSAKVSAFDWITQLTDAATDVQSFMDVDDTSSFPATGYLLVGDEYMHYSAKASATRFTIDERAALGSAAAAHDNNDEVNFVAVLTENPIEMALQLLSSTGAGTNGTYDVLADGCGINNALFDTAAFTAMAAEYGADFTVYADGINDVLQFIESELLLATGTRLYMKDNLISITKLDEAEYTGDTQTMDEDVIEGTPPWTTDTNVIVNRIIARWGYTPGTQDYSVVYEFEDATSIANFGQKKPLEYNFKCTTAAGSTIIAAMNKILARLSEPRGRLQVTTHFDQSLRYPGEDVLIEHQHVPQPAGTKGISAFLEIVGKDYDMASMRMKYDLEFTSFSRAKVGFIAPSPLIASVTSQSVFAVPAGCGKYYEAGYKLKFWDDANAQYYAATVYTIESVSGDTITLTDDVAVPDPLTTAVRVKFCDYDDASELQKKYAFICPNGGAFGDGRTFYEIIP